MTRLRDVLAPLASGLIVLLFGLITYVSAVRERQTMRQVDQIHRAIAHTHKLLTRMIDAETGERGYIITGDTAYLQPYYGAAGDVRAEYRALLVSIKNHPNQTERLALLAQLIDRRLAVLEERIAIRQTMGFDSARAAIGRAGGGKAIMDSLRNVVAVIEASELETLGRRNRALAARERTILFVIVVGALLAAAIAALISGTLLRYGNTQQRLNQILAQQANELEEQTVELEAMTIALSERTADAEHANETKAKFLAMMSHDLRTPMNAILGYVDLLQLGIHGPISEAQSEDLRRIARSCAHLLELLNQVLNYAKIEAGRVDMQIANVNVHELMATIETMVTPQAQAKGLQFTYDTCEPSLYVRADRGKLEQILVNLATNAIKFTATGGQIHVGCSVKERAVHLHVSDTGRGIPADQLEHVFQPFVQVQGIASSEHKSGVGLGLAISREFARAMSGELTLQSTVGQGTVCTLILPQADCIGATAA